MRYDGTHGMSRVWGLVDSYAERMEAREKAQVMYSDWLGDAWWYGVWMLAGFGTGKLILILWDWWHR